MKNSSNDICSEMNRILKTANERHTRPTVEMPMEDVKERHTRPTVEISPLDNKKKEFIESLDFNNAFRNWMADQEDAFSEAYREQSPEQGAIDKELVAEVLGPEKTLDEAMDELENPEEKSDLLRGLREASDSFKLSKRANRSSRPTLELPPEGRVIPIGTKNKEKVVENKSGPYVTVNVVKRPGEDIYKAKIVSYGGSEQPLSYFKLDGIETEGKTGWDALRNMAESFRSADFLIK